jgi:hypothetical protein
MEQVLSINQYKQAHKSRVVPSLILNRGLNLNQIPIISLLYVKSFLRQDK